MRTEKRLRWHDKLGLVLLVLVMLGVIARIATAETPELTPAEEWSEFYYGTEPEYRPEEWNQVDCSYLDWGEGWSPGAHNLPHSFGEWCDFLWDEETFYPGWPW